MLFLKFYFKMWLFSLVLYVFVEKCAPEIIYTDTKDVSYQIAGIFERTATTQQYAFNESLNNIRIGSVRVEPILVIPSRTDSYSVWKDMCSYKTMRPIVIFGPQNPITDSAVRNQCAIANIPHIQATWQPLDPDLYLNEDSSANNKDDEETDEEVKDEEPFFKKISINFYPDSDEISFAYGKLLNYYKWENFAVLYEDNFGLLRIQKILSEHTEKYPVTLLRLNPEEDNRTIFKQLSTSQANRILLDCHVDRVLKYMNEAAELGMVNFYQHYILVTMDASTIAESLSKLSSNITWLSITEYDKLKDSQHYLAPRIGKWTGSTPNYSISVTGFKIEALIMDDIANHIVKALAEIEEESRKEKIEETEIEEPRNDICEEDANPWQFGVKLQEQILKTQTVGVTGNIQFDEETGKRINYILYVNEICVSKRQTIGKWESANRTGIDETRPDFENVGNQQTSKHFIVISRKAKPYFYDKQPCEDDKCEDDDPEEKYEGFSVDLVKAIFKILREEGFNYTYSFHHDKDKGYGKYDEKKKKWDGLIGDLLDKKADLAVCDFTITEERKKVVDFSQPFMTLGISILFTNERKVSPGMFSFLYPYTVDVWMHTATAYCVVSIILFLCARISPADWENPQPCEKDPEELENIWSFKNCTWLTMGSIMTQGCDILPKAIGTRWVCGMWWFFAVIVCQTYIAQLSASMTSALESEPINSVEDLAKQNKILYGAYESGSTLEFFRTSKDKMYQRMYENMIANPVVLVSSNDEGEKRVLRGKNKYAFFMESSTIDYKMKRNCRLKKVGGELDSKDYGIAMPANSPFRSHINRAILRLKESTILDDIKRKWWDEKYDAKLCKKKNDDSDVVGDLEMENLIGAFVVLVVGLVLSLMVTAAEFMNEVRNIVVREQVTHKEVIIKELKASLNFSQLQKPVLRNPSRAPSVASSDSKSSDKRDKQSNAIENFIEFEKDVQ